MRKLYQCAGLLVLCQCDSSSSDGESESEAEGESECDLDKDGFDSALCDGDDCDDDDPSRNPDAIEYEDWSSQGIDDTGHPSYGPSAAVGSDQSIHMCFLGEDTSYARLDAGESSWLVEPVGNGVHGGCALVLDDLDQAYLAYVDVTGAVQVASQAKLWAGELVTDGPAGPYLGLARSADGALHVSSHDSFNDALLYSTNVGGDWLSETIDATGDPGLYQAIAIDGASAVHFAYMAATDNELRHATGESGNWQSDVIDVGDDLGLWVSMLFIENVAHVAYYDGGEHDLKYATNGTGKWVTEIVDGAGTVGGHASIKISRNSLQVLCSGDGGTIRSARGGAGAWALETITVVGGTVSEVAFVVTDDITGLWYQDSGDDDLRWLYRSLPNGNDQDCDGVTW